MFISGVTQLAVAGEQNLGEAIMSHVKRSETADG